MSDFGKVFQRKCSMTAKSLFSHGRILPLVVMVALLVSLLSSLPVSASGGLIVTNAVILANVNPGQTFTQTMTVSIGSNDPATDIAVQVTGVAQNPDGGYILLDASQDTGPYSARQFVSIDNSSFHLEPGSLQDITATIHVPQNVGNGGRYAMINIVTTPMARAGGVAMREAVNVPVYLTINGSQINDTGKITQVGAGEVISGKPVNMFVDFQNTGNCHFKVEGNVVIKDPRGQILSTVPIPLTASSILPGMARQLRVSFNPSGDLTPGTYSLDADVTLQDGTPLDNTSGTFTVNSAYTPQANTTPANLNNLMASTNTISQISPINPVAQTGILGVSWAWAGIIIGAILVIGVLVVVVIIRRVPAKK
jgi:hypothetical protein